MNHSAPSRDSLLWVTPRQAMPRRTLHPTEIYRFASRRATSYCAALRYAVSPLCFISRLSTLCHNCHEASNRHAVHCCSVSSLNYPHRTTRYFGALRNVSINYSASRRTSPLCVTPPPLRVVPLASLSFVFITLRSDRSSFPNLFLFRSRIFVRDSSRPLHRPLTN